MQIQHTHHRLSPAPRVSQRRGIVTLWVIVSLPVLLTLLVLLIDVSNIWLAKVELRNATDAAALSGVKTWGEGGSTAQVRLDANDAFATNTILGNSFGLNTAQGGCTNGNIISTGELVLGSTTDAGGAITFNCNGTPACVAGAISVSFQVNTVGATDDTQLRRTAFRITNFTGPVGSTLNSVTINLASTVVDNDDGNGDVADNGFFDFNVQGPPADNNSGANFIPAGANEDLFLGGTFVSSNNGGATVVSTNGVLNSTQTSLTVNFNSFNPGDTLNFGVDTDRVGPDNGNNGDDVADFGGHFGTGHNGGAGTLATTTGASVSFVISGQTFIGTLVADNAENDDLSALTIVDVLTGGDAFAVRARKTVSISSVADNFFGITLGPYNVSTESFARYQCTNGPPQLMQVDLFLCTCP